ncbi:MAG: hypothetical protein ACR2NP_05070, partial [Pirellulaceae bacterium]
WQDSIYARVAWSLHAVFDLEKNGYDKQTFGRLPDPCCGSVGEVPGVSDVRLRHVIASSVIEFDDFDGHAGCRLLVMCDPMCRTMLW